jgi:hypothetical protein
MVDGDSEADAIEQAIDEVSHENVERYLSRKLSGPRDERQIDYPRDLNLNPASITVAN